MNDLNKTKQYIFLGGGILVLLLIIFFAYRFLLPSAPSSTIETTPGVGGGLGGAGSPAPQKGGETVTEKGGAAEVTTKKEEQKLVQLADFPVVGLSLNKEQTKILFYKKDGGDLFASDLNGETKEKISNITIVGLFEALWPRDGSRAAVFYLDRETVKGFLHIGSTSVATLPQDITSLAWSPDGKSLAYMIPKNGTLNLSTADGSGRNPRVIFSTPILDAHASWVTGDKFSLETAPSGRAEGYLFSYSRNSGALAKLIGPLFGLSSAWSPNGSRIMVSSTNEQGQNPLLEVFDAAGKPLFDISVRTIAQKCSWVSEDAAYCAIPRVTSGFVWPDDYLRGEVNTQDRLVLLDLKKKEITEVLNEGNFDISGVSVSKNQDYLFFINRADGTPWSLKLK